MTELRKIAIKAPDFAAALAFLEDTLGLTEKFSDGSDYAELDASLGVALLSDQHYPAAASGDIALFVKVDAVGAALAQVTAAGAVQLGDVVEGGHEFRGFAQLPGTGATLVLYGPER